MGEPSSPRCLSESTSLLPVPGSSPQKTWLWCKLHDGFQSQATGGFCPYSWKSEGGAFSWLPRAGTVLSSKKGMMEEVQCKGGMMVAWPLPNPHSMPLKLEILVSQQKPSVSHQYSQIWRNASRMGEFFFLSLFSELVDIFLAALYTLLSFTSYWRRGIL